MFLAKWFSYGIHFMSVKHNAYPEKTSASGWQILDCKCIEVRKKKNMIFTSTSSSKILGCRDLWKYQHSSFGTEIKHEVLLGSETFQKNAQVWNQGLCVPHLKSFSGSLSLHHCYDLICTNIVWLHLSWATRLSLPTRDSWVLNIKKKKYIYIYI